MCRRKRDTLASHPTLSSSRSPLSSSIPSSSTTTSSFANNATTTSSSSSSSSLTTSSIASLRLSLPSKPILFPFPEIAAATNNFLTPRTSSSSWRCSLRSHDSLVHQRPFRTDPALLPSRLAAVSNSHHRSIAPLLGASLCSNRIYLVYHFIPGASLSSCLHNTRNPSFTPLSSWLSRMQIAADLAQGLDYIHHHAAAGGIVHSQIKSSAVLVTEPHFNAVICHFAAAFLSGDVEGTTGYLAPEVIAGGDVSKGSDVYAFGVLVLELISGEVPVKFRFDVERREYRRSSLVEIARAVFGELGAGEEGRGVRIRRWVDGRMKDSFPVDVAEKMIGIALRCVEEEAAKRPSMTWVQGKVSKFFLKSRVWAETVKPPADFSISLAPR